MSERITIEQLHAKGLATRKGVIYLNDKAV